MACLSRMITPYKKLERLCKHVVRWTPTASQTDAMQIKIILIIFLAVLPQPTHTIYIFSIRSFILSILCSALVVCTAVYSYELVLLKITSPCLCSFRAYAPFVFNRILPFYRCHFAACHRYKSEVY